MLIFSISISCFIVSNFPHWCSVLTFQFLTVILSFLWTVARWLLVIPVIHIYSYKRRVISERADNSYHYLIVLNFKLPSLFFGSMEMVSCYFLHHDFIKIPLLFNWLLTFGVPQLFDRFYFSFDLVANYTLHQHQNEAGV